MRTISLVFGIMIMAISGGVVAAKTYTVEARAVSFDPMVAKIQPGDTVAWINMTGHNSNSMGDEQGLTPEGGNSWKLQIGQNYSVTLETEGVYIYKCDPHYAMGMVGAIIVGKPVNINEVVNKASGMAKRAANAAKKAVESGS